MTGFAAIAGLMKGISNTGLERARAKREATKTALQQQGLIQRLEMQMDRADARAEANRAHQTAEREAAQQFKLDNAKPAKPNIQTIYTEDGREQKAIIAPADPTNPVPVGGVKADSGGFEVTTADGTTVRMGGGAGKLTEQQSKDLVFYERGAGALPTIDRHEKALTSLGENLAGNAGVVGNYLKTEEYQLAEQAGREFLAAILRKDTGAAVTQEEMTQYGVGYLPQPGDSTKVVEQKRISRSRALEAIRKGLGPAEVLAASRPEPIEQPQSGMPAPGRIEGGYRFIGGDPAAPNSWEIAQ